MIAPPVDEKRVTAMVADAVAAPSMHNAQPWRFRYSRSRRAFQLRADLNRFMPHSDPDTRALHLGCGAALLNLRVSVEYAGWDAVTHLLPDSTDPALLALVRLTGPGKGRTGIGALHAAVHRRHTSRHPFTAAPIPDDVRDTLRAAARQEGARLDFPSGWHRQWVLELAEQAEARNLTDSGSREDLARWTGTGTAAEGVRTEGVPDSAFGPRKRGGKAPVRDFAGTRRVPGREAAAFEEDPHIALLSTAEDTPVDWLRAGQAVERVLLLATLRGLSSSFVTQVLEWPDMRWPLRDPVSGAGHVQMVLRLGYGPEGAPTPRRPVREVLDIEP
ncbi:Acg family FMN-binding oxidoreductase [Streptomyces sp. bgisy100]|uniref:Acg family FMN-binding oxidoreductase n=1 Tax=Streptomyces sp. bgisy100 TaxID=3413783 RepID=UPI003D705EE2